MVVTVPTGWTGTGSVARAVCTAVVVLTLASTWANRHRLDDHGKPKSQANGLPPLSTALLTRADLRPAAGRNKSVFLQLEELFF